MKTVEEIQRALEQLPLDDRLRIGYWLLEHDTLRAEDYGVGEPQVAYAASDPPFMTLEEFLEFEAKSEIRHEYVDGYVFAMLGPSVAHERIKQRLATAFANHVRRGPCEVFSSGTQLRIQRNTSTICYYPDIMVDCRRDAWEKSFVRSPRLVLEVLSPSTHLTDRREKLWNYQEIDSVEEYALVAQDEYKVTLHRRVDGWRGQVYAGVRAAVEFRSIGLTLPLKEVYDDIVAG